MNPVDRMMELIPLLNYYTKLYDEGKPEVSDNYWDSLYFELQKLENETGIILSNSPTHHINYQVVSKLNKVEHNHPMLSLNKTKSIEDVLQFLDNKQGIAMAKMDGLTCSIKYINGELISAETRGNGLIGEDITHNIKYVKGVPLIIPFKDELIIDGEVICTYNDFKGFAEEYKNPRNFASGSIRLLDAKESAKRKLTFIAWDCVKGLEKFENLTEKLCYLDELGFITVPHFLLPSNSMTIIEYTINSFKDVVKEYSYPIDGIVFKYDNCNYYQSLGETAHHPRGGLAFKFYDEEYETYLQNIEYTMGKTGQLTPVAVYDEVDTDGSVINRASLHNLNIMRQLLGKPYKGQKIWVCKQNEIIPQVVKGEKSNVALTYIDIPTKCPICGEDTYIKDDFLYCSNSNCEGKFINRLDHFVGKKGLDIKGLSKTTLQKLVDWGWVGNYQELFSLSNFHNEWAERPGFGLKSVDNILNAIEEAKHCELWQLISALSIPNIGVNYAKKIAKEEKTWDKFIEDIENGFDFTSWDGFGYEMNKSLHDFDYNEAMELAKNILSLTNSLISQKIVESNINGKNIVITGKLNNYKNRDELKIEIEKHGGKVVSSISNKTNYLINNDINSTSTKNIAAKKLGIPIITEEELIAML